MKISYEDLQMWSVTASNPMFREAFDIAEGIAAAGGVPEIIWYGGNRATGGASNGWIEVTNAGDGDFDLSNYKKFKQRNKKKKEKKR